MEGKLSGSLSECLAHVYQAMSSTSHTCTTCMHVIHATHTTPFQTHWEYPLFFYSPSKKWGWGRVRELNVLGNSRDTIFPPPYCSFQIWFIKKVLLAGGKGAFSFSKLSKWALGEKERGEVGGRNRDCPLSGKLLSLFWCVVRSQLEAPELSF